MAAASLPQRSCAGRSRLRPARGFFATSNALEEVDASEGGQGELKADIYASGQGLDGFVRITAFADNAKPKAA